ncbi:MAG: GNAT family N-acetyltransferase [Candidatus Dormibacteraeota bacterium]|nr:GNAT family N-acetyltransferase [Candidatus Dormibacteraeota bacterium]
MRHTDAEMRQVDQLLMLAFGSTSRRKELEIYVTVQPDGFFVIEEDDRIVAAGGCLVYGSFSWMGLVGTHPEARGRGHASRLSEHLVTWSYAKGCTTVALDASALGRPIYEGLGFQPVGSTIQLGPTGMPSSRNPKVSVRRAAAADTDQVLELDAGIFGGDRSDLLQRLMGRNDISGLVTRSAAGRLTGFLFVQERLIGPGAAASPDVAQALVRQAMVDASAERTLLLPFESAYLEVLRSLGFVEQKRLTHMRHGDQTINGSRHRLLAQTSYAAG